MMFPLDPFAAEPAFIKLSRPGAMSYVTTFIIEVTSERRVSA